MLGGDEALAWHGPGAFYALLTIGVAFPFVLERLSNTRHALKRHLHARPISAVGGRVRAIDVAVLTRGAHVAWRR